MFSPTGTSLRCDKRGRLAASISPSSPEGMQAFYSITSSARASTDGGMVRPSALAVVRLKTRSNLIGCSTGRSPGFVEDQEDLRGVLRTLLTGSGYEMLEG